MTQALQDELEETGRVWFRAAVDGPALRRLAMSCDVGDKPGLRLDGADDVLDIFKSGTPLGCFLQVCGLSCAPVRLLAFNKSEHSNWSVPWHQDRVIAVSERREVPGFDHWVQRAGFWHCEPPIDLLRSMVFARVHIDAATADNGALEIAKRSHHLGKVPAGEAARVATDCDVELCEAAPGDVLLVKALTLHRSSSATVASVRRTIRADFAARSGLPQSLAWALPQHRGADSSSI